MASLMQDKTKLAHQQGMTLMELTVVLLVLTALAGLAVPYIDGTGATAQCTATETTMVAIRDAIVGSYEQPGYLEDMGALPGTLSALVNDHYCAGSSDPERTAAKCNDAEGTWTEQPAYNPATKRGWRGPYLLNTILASAKIGSTNFADNAYVAAPVVEDSPVILDSYGNPIIIQNAGSDARLVSAGPNGVLETTLSDTEGANREDDRLLYLLKADSKPDTPCNEDS